MTVAIIINLLTLGFLAYSISKSTRRTKKAVKIAFMKGINLAPWMIGIIVLIGVILSFVPPPLIEQYLGGEMTIYQVGAAALIGTISMVPNLVALPLAGSLIESGASYTTIAAFLTTLTMVGFVTLPLELKEMGRKITFWRNFLAFFAAVIIAIIIGILM